ncbi:hypothetical protein [Maribacter sp. Hel_I_7]|uniref:hypothetical protein n=1 Tax=Maribacter sp. Hel_I_7 TaxID=1249997 RepID=UPI000479FC13|nr:hypothetical protein [Maribacter sp. Hel_I_7]
MKKLSIVIALLVSAFGIAQVDVIGPADGLLLDTKTSTVLNGIGNPREGLLVGNSTTKSLWYYNGTEFVDLMDVVGGGVTDHGALSGLTDDDHTQYHTDARAASWLSALYSDLDIDNNDDLLKDGSRRLTGDLLPQSSGSIDLGSSGASFSQIFSSYIYTGNLHALSTEIDVDDPLDMQNNAIKNLAAPVNDTDAATKGYVDALGSGGGTDDQTLPEVLTEGNDAGGEDVLNVGILNLSDKNSDTGTWDITEQTASTYSGDLAFRNSSAGSSINRAFIAHDGIIEHDLHLATKLYVDTAISNNDASEVTYDPTTSGLTATDVQDAIDEIAGSASSIQSVRNNLTTGDITINNSNFISSGKKVNNYKADVGELTFGSAVTQLNTWADFNNSGNGAVTLKPESGYDFSGYALNEDGFKTALDVDSQIELSPYETANVIKLDATTFWIETSGLASNGSNFPYTNQNNSNPELWNIGAAAFPPNETNAATSPSEITTINATTSSVVVTGFDDWSYVYQIESNASGGRARPSVTILNSTDYRVDVYYRMIQGNDGRIKLNVGADGFQWLNLNSSEWVLLSHVFESTATGFQLDAYPNNTTGSIGDIMQIKISLKAL